MGFTKLLDRINGGRTHKRDGGRTHKRDGGRAHKRDGKRKGRGTKEGDGAVVERTFPSGIGNLVERVSLLLSQSRVAEGVEENGRLKACADQGEAARARDLSAEHTLPTGRLVQQLAVDVTRGLSEEDAARRLKKYGHNRPSVMVPMAEIVCGSVTQSSAALAGATQALQASNEGGCLVSLLTRSSSSKFQPQTYSNKPHAFVFDEVLRSAATAQVLRDGRLTRVPVTKLVVGDVLYLHRGAQCWCDAVVVGCEDVSATVPASIERCGAKRAKPLSVVCTSPNFSQSENSISDGSCMIGGHVLAVVTRVGRNTCMARLQMRRTSTLPRYKGMVTEDLYVRSLLEIPIDARFAQGFKLELKLRRAALELEKIGVYARSIGALYHLQKTEIVIFDVHEDHTLYHPIVTSAIDALRKFDVRVVVMLSVGMRPTDLSPDFSSFDIALYKNTPQITNLLQGNENAFLPAICSLYSIDDPFRFFKSLQNDAQAILNSFSRGLTHETLMATSSLNNVVFIERTHQCDAFMVIDACDRVLATNALSRQRTQNHVLYVGPYEVSRIPLATNLCASLSYLDHGTDVSRFHADVLVTSCESVAEPQLAIHQILQATFNSVMKPI